VCFKLMLGSGEIETILTPAKIQPSVCTDPKQRQQAILLAHPLLDWECQQHVSNMLPRQPNVGNFGRHLPVVATQNRSRHSILVSGIANIHPFLLRVPEVHTKNSSVRSGMRVMVRRAERYMVSDTKKISM
jgi:hypothetical protein